MKKKKKNNKRKKILLLLLLLLFASLLTTETYAWFTVNRLVTVNTLDVHITSKGGISISTDASDWKAMVDSDDINNATMSYPGSTNQLPETLEPVSTGGILDTTTKFMKMYYGQVGGNSTGDYILTAERTIEESGNEGKFVAFDLFFKIDQASPLYLGSESQVIYTGDSEESKPGIENSIRLAFIYQGTLPYGSALISLQSQDNATNDDVYIWEPNYDLHTSTGVSHALETYSISINETGNDILSYDGIIDEITEEENILVSEANSTNYETKFKTVEPKIKTISGYTENQKIMDLPIGVSKFRVYMWIEGQDVDCENNASIGEVQFNFQFSLNP